MSQPALPDVRIPDPLSPAAPGIPWTGVWAGNGIALAHAKDAWYREPESGHATLQPVRRAHGTQAVPGDVVVLFEGRPDARNQELRRVLAADPSPFEGEPSLRLGPPLARREWPAGLLSLMEPLVLPVRVSGETATLTSETGAPILSVGTRGSEGVAFLDALRKVVAEAARAGAADGSEGCRRGYAVAKGSDRDGGRAWVLSDDRGETLATLRRGLLDRSPPRPAETLRRAAEAAYGAAREDTVLRATLPPGPVPTALDAPCEEASAPAP